MPLCWRDQAVDGWGRQGLRQRRPCGRDAQGLRPPHVARKARQSAIDGRTSRHEGYALSIRPCKWIDEAVGWAKTVGGVAQAIWRGMERVRSRFILTMAANTLARLPGPLMV